MEWRPIETAPTGVRVLIYGDETGIITWTCHGDEGNEWPEGTTWWQPLPDRPRMIGSKYSRGPLGLD